MWLPLLESGANVSKLLVMFWNEGWAAPQNDEISMAAADDAGNGTDDGTLKSPASEVVRNVEVADCGGEGKTGAAAALAALAAFVAFVAFAAFVWLSVRWRFVRRYSLVRVADAVWEVWSWDRAQLSVQCLLVLTQYEQGL